MLDHIKKIVLLDFFLLLSGTLLLSLAFAFPDTVGFLSLFAFVPMLFYVNKKVLDTGPHAEWKKAGMKMFIAGLAISAISTSWFFNIFPLDWLWKELQENLFLTYLSFIGGWLLLISILAAPYGLLGICASFFKKSDHTLAYPFLIAGTWVLLEASRAILFSFVFYGDNSLFGFHYTYYSISYAVSSIKILNTLLSIGGVYLLSFMVLLINGTIYLVVGRKSSRSVISFLSLIIVLVLISSNLYMQSLQAAIQDKEVEVTLLTTNLEPAKDKNVDTQKIRAVSDYLSSSPTLSKIIIVPENINLTGMLSAKNETLDGRIVIGSLTKGEQHRLFYGNSAENRIDYFDKKLLVPVVEYEFILTRIFRLISGNVPKKKDGLLQPQKDIEASDMKKVSDDIAVYASICSENISPILYRKETEAGAGMLINVSSLAIFRGSPLVYRQMMAINRARALENGRYFIVASNYSDSYVLDDKGNEVSTVTTKDKVFAQNVMVKNISYLTPYVKYGDYFIVISGLLVLSLLILKKKHIHGL